MQECSRCGLINSPEAGRCDCGHDLSLRAQRLRRSVLRTAGLALIWVPLFLLLTGTVSMGGLAAGFFVLWIGRWVAAMVLLGMVLILVDGLRKPRN